MSKNYIGRLTAMLTARDAGFSETLAKARAKVASFGNEATKHTKTISAASSTLMGRTSQIGGVLTNSIGGLVGGLSVIGAAYTAISNVGAALDRMGKSADDAAKLGMQDMPEFLAGLQYRAKLVGVEANSVSDSLGKLFRTIAEARAGSKADQDILSTLGLSVASLSGQSPDKVVLRVADALDQVADSGERARLAVALFGRSGANMVNVLRGGSRGVLGDVGEAQALGVARSAADLAAADAAGDALDRLKIAADGLFNTLTVALSPTLTGFANYLTNASKSVQAFDFKLADLLPGVLIGRQLPSLMNSGSELAEQLRVAKIRNEVANRERLRAAEARKEADINQRFEQKMSAVFAERRAVVEEIARKEAEIEASRLAAAEELRMQNLEIAEKVAAMIGSDGGIARAIPEISGGAPLITSGSSEAQMAQFNSTNMRIQSAAERQLSVTERIDKAISEIQKKADEEARLIQKILERLPTVQPL